MIQEFMKYVNNYDTNKESISSRIDHSIRVYKLMTELARKLNFSETEIELSGVIGLLHDIGRFEQIKKSDSFDDLNGLDHADIGIKILFEDGLIKQFYRKEEYYQVIEFAIKNHNKFALEESTDEMTMKLAKLIRDVDKIDILYLLGAIGEFKKSADESEISKKVLETIDIHRCINLKDVKTNNDQIAYTFALAFDINYYISLKFIRKNLIAFYERVEKGDTFKNIYDEVMKYLNERIDKLC